MWKSETKFNFTNTGLHVFWPRWNVQIWVTHIIIIIIIIRNEYDYGGVMSEDC